MLFILFYNILLWDFRKMWKIISYANGNKKKTIFWNPFDFKNCFIYKYIFFYYFLFFFLLTK